MRNTTPMRHGLAILALCLACIPCLAAAADDVNADSRSRSTAVALNYCRASFHRIRRYPTKPVLIEEQEKILNNLNLNGIVDEEVIRLYSSVLEEIGQIQIADQERNLFKRKYKQELMRQIGFNTFLFGTQMALGQYPAAIRTGAASWWDYRFTSLNRDLEIWKVDKTRMTKVVDKSSEFLDTFWKLTQKKNIPDRWLVRGDDLDKLEEAMLERDPVVRLRVLGRMEHFMECYPPYWYYVARTKQQLGQLFAAAETFNKLTDLGAGHFRKDDMLAAGLANRAAIQEYLQQPGAEKTALEALRYSTDAWEANLMCARVLERHGMLDRAEDAILRNLDVDLERSNSLVALLSLYHHSKQERKLIARLEDPAVARDIPIPVLLQILAQLGPDKLPKTVPAQISESLYAFPRLHFGPDDLVVSTGAGWQAHSAKMTLELAGRRYEQPQFAVGKDSLEMQFRGIIDVRSPFAPLPADLGITLLAEYPEAPPIRVHLRQLSHSVAAAADRHSADFPAPPESTDGRSIPRNALRISLIEVGETSIPILTGSSERDFTPTAPGEPASAAADTSPAPVNPPSKTDATAVAIDPAGAAEKRTSDLPTVEPAPAPAPPPPPERPLEIIPKIEPP